MMKQKRFLLITIFAALCVAATAQTDGSSFYSSTYPKPTVTTSYYDDPAPQPQQRLGILPTTRGNFMIGTGIGFSTSKSNVDVSSPDGNFSGNGGTSVQVNFSPGIGYFFARDFVFGVGMEFIGSRTTAQKDLTNPSSGEQTSENSNVLFGPFARLYLAVSDDKAFFLGTTLGFGSSRDQFDLSAGNTQTINNNIVTLGIGPGFTVFSKSGLALEALVKYNYAHSHNNIDLDGTSRETNTHTNAVDFSVGIQYYFGGFRRIDRTTPTPGGAGNF